MSEEENENENTWTVKREIQTKSDAEHVVVCINGGEELVPRTNLMKRVKKLVQLTDGSTEEVESEEPDIPGFINRISKAAGLSQIDVGVDNQSVNPTTVLDLNPETISVIDIRSYDAPR